MMITITKMIDENNYQQWAMEYIEGTLDVEKRRAFDAFLASHASLAQQIAALKKEMPVLTPQQIVYPDKELLLRGRKIRLARRQERLQRFGAIASGAAAAAVLFGGLLFFNPGESRKGTAQMAAEAARDYPEGAAALAAQQEAESAAEEAAAIASANAASTPPEQTVRTTGGNRIRETKPSSNVPSASASAQPDVLASLAEPAELYVPVINPASSPAVVQAAIVQLEPAPTAEHKAPESPIAQQDRSTTDNTATQRVQTKTQNRARAEARTRNAEPGELHSLLATLNDVSPISIFRTTKESGVTIASIISISKKNDK